MRLLLVAAFCLGSAGAADWNPRLAAQYLDSRQKEWSAWPPAQTSNGPCVSCHTGVTYLLARPALRKALGEKDRTPYETGLLNGLRARVDKKEGREIKPSYAAEPRASQAMGVESILAAWALASEDPAGAETQRAFDRMWSLQIGKGSAAGAWAWFSLDDDPWEMPESQFYGATLAAMAVAAEPAEYRRRPQVQEKIAALAAYLRANLLHDQPAHNGLMLLWAATKLPEAMPDFERKAMVDALWRTQNADGGWSLEALGPWKKHDAAPPSTGSNSYATAFTTFVLEQTGASPSKPELRRALDWLIAHQDPQTGSWPADSMNKVYDPDSMPAKFMRDAATGFAVLALVGAGT